MLRPARRPLVWVLSLLSLAAGGLVATTAVDRAPLDCPRGTIPASALRESTIAPDAAVDLPPEYRGPEEADLPASLRGCTPFKGPESFQELALRDVQQSAIRTAPFGSVAPGAALNAAQERQALAQEPSDDVPGADGVAQPYGVGSLVFDDERYDSSGTGIEDATGRIDDFHFDEATGRLFAAIGTGGVWLSEDRGATWRPVSDPLPTQVVSAVTYTPAGGPDGTLIALTGEHTYGGSSFLGIGAYWSTDLGATWTRAEGLEDGELSFALEYDAANPEIVYAATGAGLWRSTDAGRSFEDVVLPTGDCAGDYNDATCNFANFVTDVVVKAPGGVGEDVDGSDVLAVVGWRAGTMTNPDGTVQSCCNGVYRSATGEPGTFERLDGLDAAVGGQERIGRVEFGPATGAEQDHDIVYAIVEDAVLFNGGGTVDPLPGGGVLGANPTVFNGIYYSGDFGATWTQLADDQEMSDACAVNQSVYCIPGVIEPGAQSWYNMWIVPDPTRQIGGVPSRLVLGLEEVWQSRINTIPQNTPATSFQVIGAYYGSVDCLLVATNCAVNGVAGNTTTHPDQHDGIILPTVDEAGETVGVQLLVGHDGGLSQQVTNLEDEFSQATWILDQESNGLQTLLPYSAVIANDGVAYAGLQDNGHMRVSPEDGFRQFETYGADGTFSAVDPNNSDYAIESTQNAGMNVTVDGGQTWRDIAPPVDNVKFVNPFIMDPLDPDHVVTGGQQIVETLAGPNTADGTEGNDWQVVYDLGLTDSEPVVDTEPVPENPANGMSAIDVRGDAVYVGYCGVCDILNQPFPFQNGIVTNVGGPERAESGTAAGWHEVEAEGLPNRYITSLAIDPYDASMQTIYATLGGYSRRWVPPGTAGESNPDLGEGHVFKSTDGGRTFTDISGNLPDTPALWVEPRGDQLMIGTDLGAFLSSDTAGGPWAVVPGIPSSPVYQVNFKADDPNTAILAVYGRGLWTYTFPDDVDAAEVRRVAGPDRTATAVQIAREAYQSAGTVVIARQDVYADALAGAPLATREDAPLLLTPSAGLPQIVRDEITRLGATRAVLLGGTAALSPQVEADLAALGITDVTRYSGSSRFGTAASIAAELGGTDVYVVKGNDPDPTRGWPDAMSIAPVAAAQGRPILLVETDRLPEETAGALESLGATGARIVGGTGAVSDDVAREVNGLAPLGERIAGADRFATSVAAATVGIEEAGLTVGDTWLARGGAFPDALAAGPSVAATGGSLVLVNDTDLDDSPPSRDFLVERACEIDLARILGGTAAISQGVQDAVTGLLDGCPTGLPTPPEPDPFFDPEEEGEEPVAERGVVAGPFGFETDEEGWTVDIASPGVPPTTWSRTTPGRASESSFGAVRYGDLADTSLTSPPLAVPGGEVVLSWWNAFDLEGGGYDEVEVSVSTDGGETFEVLDVLGGQNVGYPEFSREEATFDAPAGEVVVRFLLYSDEICSGMGGPACARTDGYEGIRVDDIALEAEIADPEG